MRPPSTRRFAMALLGILIACGGLGAQTTGQLRGTVKDATGAVVPGQM